jgi:hypothetical protein
MKIIVIITILFLILVGIVLVLRGNENTWICSNGSWIKHGNPTAVMPTKSCGQDKTNPLSVINPNANIILENPKSGEVVTLPFVIKGKAKVFENQLNFRVLDSQGRSFIEGTLNVKSPGAGKFGPFDATISSMPQGKTTIEVFDKSPKDGTEIDKVIVVVNIK